MRTETRKRLVGSKAPNWQGGKTSIKHICRTCNVEFAGRAGRIYCSKPCAYGDSGRGERISKTRGVNGNLVENDMERLVNKRFAEYRASAKKKDREFGFDKESFRKLLLGDCSYCGSELALGVDRLDSSKDYVLGNAVSCCTKCNFAKHTMTVEEFKEHISRIYNNLSL